MRMGERFASAYQRIGWAEEQILELKARSFKFFELQGEGRFTETDPKTGHVIDKVRLTGPLPNPVVRNAVQVVESLRSALDHAACAVVNGPTRKRGTYFPFVDKKRELPATIASKCKHVPHEIKSLFATFKPYKSGNPPLWALNKICNTAKHRTIVEPGIHIKDMTFEDVWNVGWPRDVVSTQPIWARRKNEIVVSKTIGGSTVHHDVEFSLAVAFGKVPVFSGTPALTGLRYLTSIVKRIVMATEAEAKRIGIR